MIELENIQKTYGARESATHALRGVSLQMQEGGFAVILGASGSGKSTLLHIASGLDRPDGGHVRYGNRDISALSDRELTAFRREAAGFVFQQYYLIPHLTVEKNVRMGAELAGNGAWLETLAAVGLGDKLKKYPAALSGGEQQRVAVARALAKKPKVLFLDEPTGALDEETGRKLLDMLQKLHQAEGFTMLMATHNAGIAEMADTVIRMNSGKITDVSQNAVRKSAYEIGW